MSKYCILGNLDENGADNPVIFFGRYWRTEISATIGAKIAFGKQNYKSDLR